MTVEGLETVSLPAVISRYGVELSRRGRNLIGLCPFHADKDPSFTVFPDGRFKCFGCGEHGDAADFVQKAQGVDFKGALQILGIRPGPVTPEIREDIERRNRQRTMQRCFNDYLRDATDETGLLCRATRRVLDGIRTPTDLDDLGDHYHYLFFYEYHHEVLALGGAAARMVLQR